MASCGKEKKAEEVYRATLNNKQKFRKEKKVRDEIQANRQLISQLQRNIREFKWNPQLGFIQIQDLIKENAALVDSEDGANNYAEFCIHPDAQYKNKSAEWKSSVTADHPMFKDLGKKKGNIPVQKDMVLKSILQSKTGSQPKPVPSFASLSRSTSNPPSFKNLTNQMKSEANNLSDRTSAPNIDGRKQESSLKRAPNTSKWSNVSEDKVSSLQEIVTVSSSDQESPEFDLCPDDDIIIEDEEVSPSGPGGITSKNLSNNMKPLFNMNQNPQSILGPGSAQNPTNFRGRTAPTFNRGGAATASNNSSGASTGFNNSSSGRGQTSSFLNKIRGSIHQPGIRPVGGRNTGGQNTGGYNGGGGQNRAGASSNWNQHSEQSSGSGGNQGINNSGKPNQPVSAFKTAHQQLFIDQQNKNRRGGRGGGYQGGMQRPGGGQGGGGEITHASYGGGVKKCLGTRPGPASGFKPPVKQEDQQPDQQNRGFGGHGPGNSNAAAYNQGQGQPQGNQEDNPEYQDPRYKNIDQKMIELILNEIMDHGSPVHWDDIAGLKFQKKTVKEIVVLPMLRPDIFTGLRGPPKGLLLFGPPGTGKTLIGKCIACQSKSTFFSISASSLTSKWVGEGEKMVRALFAVAKVHQPSVIFIDEIDSLLSARSESEHESSRRMKTEFLVQLDGAGTDGDEKILIVGATNRPQELDEAARRRLVKRLLIPLPEGEARLQIIQNLLGKERNDLSEEDMAEIVCKSSGYSGADMSNLCREAAMGPIRSVDISMIEEMDVDQVRPINKQDLLDALRQVKASVSDKDLQMYEDWNEKYGAGK